GSGAEDAGQGPGLAAAEGVRPARLAEVRRDGIELPPADDHVQRIHGVDGDRRLVGGVPDDVVLRPVDIDLDALIRTSQDSESGRAGGKVIPSGVLAWRVVGLLDLVADERAASGILRL